ncbi:MAG: methyltransferase domain-containing protein [Patescibacteria group bacterium]|jgi:ubiquinone/menaquinone biosynthesis C-methylase UbiE
MQMNSPMIDVKTILYHAQLKLGDYVADFGTGREAKLALPAAAQVGKNGIVYAVDVVKTILPAVQNKAKMHGLNNVQTVWSDLEIYGATKAIRDNSLMVGFMVTVLFQSKQRAKMVQECHRMVRPGGKLIVVDWKPDVTAPLGPVNDMRVHPEEVKKIAEDLHMQLTAEFNAGPYHWGLVFVK